MDFIALVIFVFRDDFPLKLPSASFLKKSALKFGSLTKFDGQLLRKVVEDNFLGNPHREQGQHPVRWVVNQFIASPNF